MGEGRRGNERGRWIEGDKGVRAGEEEEEAKAKESEREKVARGRRGPPFSLSLPPVPPASFFLPSPSPPGL